MDEQKNAVCVDTLLPQEQTAEDAAIDAAAAQIMKKYRKAFLELAK